ncbi:MAG TPA: bifunctional UDP-4-keto-pentose/UDP-xylose synthase [Steroidobacteraceae bacterium]|nr:bifunctional UDP-4-keto-pentose/UDP-xylose synthase [Steroidobacteraceae bacterium]
MKRLLILGVNGFIGHHLSAHLLRTSDWHVYGMDLENDRVTGFLDHPRFHFCEGDITIHREWLEYHVRKCDVVLPLVAIATPATYVSAPLRVFELDFEANLPIVRLCVKHKKRIVFPSTSELYGMCGDAEFDPYESNFVLGPIPKSRWIYSCIKQLLDRVIWAYGTEERLDFTLFRPFNWIGPGLDNINAPKEGSSRVVTQFLGQIVRGDNITLVDGGRQRRCFTSVYEGVDCLARIIENRGGIATGKIYNIGNPVNDHSVRELAEMLLGIAATMPEYRERARNIQFVERSGSDFYGAGYQDIQTRVPRITNTREELGWEPRASLADSLMDIMRSYAPNVVEAGRLIEDEEHVSVAPVERRHVDETRA